jgi:hypothetical protein
MEKKLGVRFAYRFPEFRGLIWFLALIILVAMTIFFSHLGIIVLVPYFLLQYKLVKTGNNIQF